MSAQPKPGADALKTRTFSTTLAWLFLVFLLLVIIAATMWANLQWVQTLSPESEFQNKWQITRGLIFDRRNPYDEFDGYQFTAPLPVVLLYFPFALVEDYVIARAAWVTALQISTVVFISLCFRNADWEIRRWLAGITIIFALIWFPSVSIYIRGSEAIFMAALFGGALLAIQNEQDEIGGILLALAALQPRITWVGIALLLLWVASQRRWLFYFWAAATFLFIGGIGMIFLPRWPLDFFWAVIRNVDFSFGKTIIETTTRWWPGIGEQIGWGLIIIMTLLLIVEWWLVWRKETRRLAWTLALTWVVAIWIGFATNIDHVFLLLFSLTIIFTAWNRRWGRSGLIFNLGALALLLPGLWWAYIFFRQRGIGEAANPVLMIAFPLFVMLGLYWIRWWYLRPEYLNLSES